MKIRFDFVTNSSSASFICYGVTLDDIEDTDKLYLKAFDNYVTSTRDKEWFRLTEEELADMDDEAKIEFVQEEIGLYEAFENDPSLSIGGYDNDIIGITPGTYETVFPNEKCGDVRRIAAEELNRALGTSFTAGDIELYEQAWHD